MNHFDAVDFSECHSEGVMFLLTLSVYIQRKETKREAGTFSLVIFHFIIHH